MYVSAVVVLCAWTSAAGGERRPVARSPLGALRGRYLPTRRGRAVAAFTAVPYAQPPLGDLRFKAPVSVRAWGEDGGESGGGGGGGRTLEAGGPSPPCVQRNPYTRERSVRGQEDCLYLNIYTPLDTDTWSGSERLPVMVWLHGGGWMCGDASTEMYGPEFLLDYDVLLVTVNYRLGPLGFLSTGDEECPGNNGLKDQQEALRFVQRNIYSFGGDNSSVTIFGESAGGASVHYHMLSQTSAGLFHKAISQSGTALVPWAESPPGEALRNAFRLAKYLDCPQAPSADMIACLRTRDSHRIIDTEFMFYDWDYEPMTPFKAVVEPDLPGAFLTRSPRERPGHAEGGAVPWLTGLNKDEGCLKSVWITSNSSRYQAFMSGLERIAPLTFYYESSPLAAAITRRLRARYLRRDRDHDRDHIDTDTDLNAAAVLQMYSDSYFNYPLVEGAELAMSSPRASVFLYELTYRATNSFSQIFGDPHNDYGVCHADELMHLFPIRFLSQPASPRDLAVSDMLLTLWTNFATSGNPNRPVAPPGMAGVEWRPASLAQLDYLELSARPEMRARLAERSRFWGTLPLWHTFAGRAMPPHPHTDTRDEL